MECVTGLVSGCSGFWDDNMVQALEEDESYEVVFELCQGKPYLYHVHIIHVSCCMYYATSRLYTVYICVCLCACVCLL